MWLRDALLTARTHVVAWLDRCWTRSPLFTLTGAVLLFGLFALALTYALPILIGIIVGIILIGVGAVLLVALLRLILRR